MKSLLIILAFAQTATAQIGRLKNAVPLNPPATKDAATPFLLKDGDGFWLSWQEKEKVRVARFAKGKWSAPVTAVGSPRLMINWADFPSLQRDGQGHLYLHWLETPEQAGAHGYFVNMEKSTDRGLTWKSLGRLHRDANPHAEHGFVSMVGARNGVRAFWLDGGAMKNHDDAMQLRAAEITEKIGNETVVDEKVCSCCGTSAVSTGDGPLVFYRDRSDREIRDISFARLAGKNWKRTEFSRDGWEIRGCPVNGPDAASDGNSVAMAWYSGGGQRTGVRLSFSRDGGKSFAPGIAVDDFLQGSLGRVQVALLGADLAMVVWMKSAENGKADIYARKIRSDGRRGPPVLIAETQSSRGVGFPQMLKLEDEIFLTWTEEGLKMIRFSPDEVPDVTDKEIPVAAKSAGFSAGEYVPNFSALDVSGKKVDLTAFKGKTILLNFWASWCDACIEEFGLINELEKKHAARGLKIILVNIDEDADWPKAKALIEQAKLKSTVWRNTAERTTAQFGYSALPYTVLLDSELKLRSGFSGSLLSKKEGLEKQILQLLK